MEGDLVEGAVDHRGCPISRSRSGRWTSALFIIGTPLLLQPAVEYVEPTISFAGVEIAERFAYYGVSANLITYLTGPLHEPVATAAAAVNTWSGVSMVLPLLGAFLADSYVGRYRMISAASLLYILSLGLLTLSAMLPALRPPRCDHTESCPPSSFSVTFFYFSLYLVAIAQGGHKPCVQAFGADQFDQNDPKERVSKNSFFNWWYFSLCGAVVATILILSYVQDNVSWGLGFGIPCIVMIVSLTLFLIGTQTYRYYLLDEKNPFLRIAKTLILMAKSRLASNKSRPSGEEGEFRLSEESNPSRLQLVEEAKGVLRLFPIWSACLMFAVIFAQSSTFFTKQGATLNRSIGGRFNLPPAALQSIIGITVLIFMPVYDRVFVPTTRKFSGLSSGITMLQRIGIGMFLSMISMVIAALVEMKRLKTAKDYGLSNSPKATIPMSLGWMTPQYVLFGMADVFTLVGLQEFFYDQVPDTLRTLGLALYLSILGIGSFISSLLISVVNKVTSKSGESWLENDLNRAHLDYFYLLLSGLSAAGLVIYIFFAQSYVYKKKEHITS